MALGVIFNILLIILFLFYWTVVFMILYHLSRFGVGVQPKKFAAAFLVGTVILFTACIIFYASIDLRTLEKLI
jgi:hypothetical protein